MEKILLDCDPGHDDAIAMIMAVTSPSIELLAVTTSAGNQEPVRTLENAMKILTLLGVSNVPVSSGNKKPLTRKLMSGVTMHGVSGLDGANLPYPNFPVNKLTAIELIAKTIRESDKLVTIVVTGPCTNVALFLSVYPTLKKFIKQIVIFGGGMGVGNWQPTTEFNMLEDPEAADIVLKSGVPIVLMPLNVGFKAELLPVDMGRIKKIKNEVSEVVYDLLDYYRIQFNNGNRQFDGVPLFDPCTVAWLINKQIFTGKDCNVEVETKGELTAGETVIDYYGMTDRTKNAHVLFDLDRSRFVDLIIESLNHFK